MAKPNLLTVASAAEWLHISSITFRRLLKSGELKFYKVRNRILIEETELDRYLQENQK